MIVTIIIISVLLILWILSLTGRTGHKGFAALHGWAFAHRGLHASGVPENSIAAFQRAVDYGYGIELDVHLLKDGNLAVIHDHSLLRTAGIDKQIEDLTVGELENYFLERTGETIPNFQDVLSLVDGKTPMIVELKSTESNYAALTETVCMALENYTGAYCIESFDPRCICWLRKHRPEIIRGQLSENFLRSRPQGVPFLLCLVQTLLIGNFLSRPDFIAYNFLDKNYPGVILARKLWGVQGVTWTLTSQQEYDTAVKQGWIPIFEDFNP